MEAYASTAPRAGVLSSFSSFSIFRANIFRYWFSNTAVVYKHKTDVLFPKVAETRMPGGE